MTTEFLARKELVQRLKDPALQRYFNKEIPAHAVNWAVHVVKNMAAAEVEIVRHGRWITRGRWVHCSECGTTGSPRWKRCPLCEAKMDKEDEDG